MSIALQAQVDRLEKRVETLLEGALQMQVSLLQANERIAALEAAQAKPIVTKAKNG
jgi:hypothetical protein